MEIPVKYIFLFFFSIVNIIYPKYIIKDLYEYGGKVINYISSVEFKNLSLSHSQNELIDSIFKYSLEIADNDIEDALLFCSIGTSTYSDFEVVVPVIKSHLTVYVFNSLDTLSYKKMAENLPEKLFDDSPANKFGDKDKITHFFSSAFLSFSFTGTLAENTGFFVEYFEEAFKSQSKIDERDLNANSIGREFGIKLKEKLIFPSEVLNKYRKLTNG